MLAISAGGDLSLCAETPVLNGYLESGQFYRGPEVCFNLLREMGLRKYGIQSFCDIKIFTTEYFYPYPWWKELNQDLIKENTYCIHHWQLSWQVKNDLENI